MRRITAATKAFNKPDIISDPLDIDAGFNDYDSRRLRYYIYWSFYENTTYEEMAGNFRKWVRTYKTQYGLYKYIRNIYNPAYRLGEFWKAHLWAGSLDDIPLVFPDGIDDDRLTAAIRQVWAWSNWEVKKDIVPLYGAIMGDVAIRVIDDPRRGKVYFDVVHPGNLSYVERDPMGNVKGYQFQEERLDPRAGDKLASSVTYTETAVRDGDNVVYTTFLNGSPYGWYGEPASWARPYGFVPMVVIQHNDVGLEWGWSEIHPGQSKFREVDDQASNLSDQIRKTVQPKWMFSGTNKPSSSPTATETSLTGTAAANRPQPGREEEGAFYSPNDNARPHPLIAPLPIKETSDHIATINKQIELDFPELRLMAMFDEQGSNLSGRALRIARQPAETKVNQRRPGYYNALKRINQMAVGIAGFNGYAGFDGYGLDSYDRGDLNHRIGKMPIFAVDPLDDLELVREKAAIIQTLTAAGASIEQAARAAGYDEDEASALAQIDIIGLER